MRKAKYIIIIIFFICSCRSEFKYGGLRVKFVKYEVENYIYSGYGWGNAFTMKYRVLRGNKHYKKNEIISERFGDYPVKIWMVQRKIGKTFNVLRDGYPLSWMLYF